LKPVFLPMLFILMVLLVGVVYGIWSENLRVNTYISMLKPHLEIGSWRLFAIHPGKTCMGFNSAYLSLENDTLHVLIGSEVVNALWIGLVVENNGELDFKLEGLNITLVDSIGEYNTTPQIYMYGPIKTGIGNKPYWGLLSCSDLPVENYTSSLPVIIPTGYKLVVWLYIELGVSNTELIVKLDPGYS